MKKLWRNLFHIDHLLITLLTLLLMQVLALATLNISFLNPLARTLSNFSMTDVFYDILNTGREPDTSDIITMVDMTDLHDRADIAAALLEVQSLEPAVIGVDIVFEGRKDSMGDQLMSECATQVASQTVFAFKLADWVDSQNQFSRTIHSFFADSVSTLMEGFTNVRRDINGGTVRSMGVSRQAQGVTCYSLPSQVASLFTGDSLAIRRLSDRSINYTSTRFPVVRYDSLWEREDLIRGHVVLFGATHDSGDMHYTPVGHIPGLEVLCYATQTMIDHREVREAKGWKVLLITLFLIWLAQLYRYVVSKSVSRRKSSFMKYVSDTGILTTYATFFLICVLMGINFWLFVSADWYVNILWSLMGIALLGNANTLYGLLVNGLYTRYHWSILRHSLFFTLIKPEA